MPTFAVVVLCRPGTKRLAEGLRSVAWADEILLLHAGGAPPPGAGEFPALRVRALGGPAEAKKYRAEIRSDWVLQLWGGERVDARLAEELRALRRGEAAAPADSCRLRVRSYILGEWVEGSVSGPSPAARLARNAKEVSPGWWEKNDGASDVFQGWIEDDGCADLGDAVERVQEVSDFWSGRMLAMNPAPGPGRAVLRSVVLFLQMLFANRIFARGLAGVTLAALASYAVLLSGAKLWEGRRAKAAR